MKATSNEIMQEHLCEMMERLLDDELFNDEESAKKEIERAKAMSELVSTSVHMQRIDVLKKQLTLDALLSLSQMGFSVTEINESGLLPNKLKGTL